MVEYNFHPGYYWFETLDKRFSGLLRLYLRPYMSPVKGEGLSDRMYVRGILFDKDDKTLEVANYFDNIQGKWGSRWCSVR